MFLNALNDLNEAFGVYVVECDSRVIIAHFISSLHIEMRRTINSQGKKGNRKQNKFIIQNSHRMANARAIEKHPVCKTFETSERK